MSIREAATALADALRTVAGVRVYSDPGAAADPPACLVGPPMVTWDAHCGDPTTARFAVVVVVPFDERATERLWDLLPVVAAAIDAVPGAAVTTATPTAWQTSGTELPAYELTVEIGL